MALGHLVPVLMVVVIEGVQVDVLTRLSIGSSAATVIHCGQCEIQVN